MEGDAPDTPSRRTLPPLKLSPCGLVPEWMDLGITTVQLLCLHWEGAGL